MAEEREAKPKEQIEMERAAEELERKIVRFTNVDGESFTHSFRGISTTVAPGASQIMRYPEADHLATHLARKMLSRKKKAELPANDSKGVQLWTEKSVEELKARIISEVGEETPRGLSAEEAHKRDLESLDREFGKPPKGASAAPAPTGRPKDVTKKDVIKELEARGIEVDEKKTKEELLEILMDAVSRGIEPK
jgi:hypothetical protein